MLCPARAPLLLSKLGNPLFITLARSSPRHPIMYKLVQLQANSGKPIQSYWLSGSIEVKLYSLPEEIKENGIYDIQ